MSRKLTLVLALGAALMTVAACDRQASMADRGAPIAPSPTSPAAAPLVTPSVASENRNWPVRSGLNNDPENPSGAPGPGSSVNIVR